MFNRSKMQLEVYDGDALHIGTVPALSSKRFTLVHARYARVGPGRNLSGVMGVDDVRIRYECDS